MKLLITAFEPFMGLNTNSSYEVVKGLKQKSNITKIFLPVKLHESFSILKKHIDEVNPDIIILCGQAASRSKISIETKARNVLGRSIDESDEITSNIIVEDGPTAYFSKFPTVEALSYLLHNDIPVELSNNAGEYICNALYYQVMHCYPDIETVFIHFPLYKNQVDNKGIDLDILIKGLEKIIESL